MALVDRAYHSPMRVTLGLFAVLVRPGERLPASAALRPRRCVARRALGRRAPTAAAHRLAAHPLLGDAAGRDGGLREAPLRHRHLAARAAARDRRALHGRARRSRRPTTRSPPTSPDSELHELPGTCAHFVIDTDGTIYQLVPLDTICRHTVGLNYTAIGIEHVGTSDGEMLGNAAQMRASLRLTAWLHVALRHPACAT